MSQIQIRNRVQNDFGMVPRALWSMDISTSAKLCAAYLFCLPDGAAPYVAQIEKETGLGRDARRKAFAELLALKIIDWEYVRDDASRIVSKTLVVDHLPVVIAGRAPDIQAVGVSTPQGVHAPDFPAGGLSTPQEAVVRPSTACVSGDNLRKEKEKDRALKVQRAANARSAPRRGPVARPMGGGSGPAVSDLSEFQKARVLSGQSVLVGDALLSSASPAMQSLRAALRGQNA